MIPVLQITRGPETSDEKAAYERMNAVWNAVWESVAKAPRGRRDTSLASRAAAVALFHYALERKPLPEKRSGFVKIVQNYATEKGLHLSDELRDQTTWEFVEAVLDSLSIDLRRR
jgi:hypothetical protein